jgi:hypothetical protein
MSTWERETHDTHEGMTMHTIDADAKEYCQYATSIWLSGDEDDKQDMIDCLRDCRASEGEQWFVVRVAYVAMRLAELDEFGESAVEFMRAATARD